MKKLFFFMLFLTILRTANVNAQVTIGANEAPQSFSVLELKSNTSKGFRLPQMTTVQRNLMQASSDFQNEKTGKAIGLIIFNTDSGCEELWNGTEWKSLCGNASKADFSVLDCSLITVNGIYYNDVSLMSGNYLIIPVDVTKTGIYSINVVTNPENGYYFTASGEFLSTGTVNVQVPGLGTPVNYTPPSELGDELVITLNGNELNCSNKPHIKIGDNTIRPKFGISCQSITVSGVVKKNVPLNNTNKITLRLNVQSGSQGAEWECYTDNIDGIEFRGSGTLGSAGSQEITLYGQGTAHVTSPKEFTVYTNSESTSATCKALVVPVIAQKKIVEFAYSSGQIYGLASGNPTYGGGPKHLLNSNMNYGENINSIVKYEGFSNITHLGALPAATTLSSNYCKGANAYDIIIITYNETPDAAQRQVLVDYVNAGGVLIYLDQNVVANTASMIGAVFDETLPAPVGVGVDCNYVIKMNSIVDDDITNGAFGDVRAGQWGEDFSNTCALTKIPKGAIVYSYVTNAYSGNTVLSNGGKVTMLRHPTKNFFWCGDSGLIDSPSLATENTDNLTHPFKLGSVSMQGTNYPYYPIDKENYGSQTTSRMPVCNSTLFANIMAWALRMAEENGINSGK